VTLRMLWFAARDGTTDIIAPPHANPAFPFDEDCLEHAFHAPAKALATGTRQGLPLLCAYGDFGSEGPDEHPSKGSRTATAPPEALEATVPIALLAAFSAIGNPPSISPQKP
jgi:hypothetical protein